MMFRIVVPLLAAFVLLGGCATKRYGRMPSLTTAEGRLLSCNEIEREIAKTRAFIDDIEATGFDGRDVLGILGDFGIGNAMERSDAIKSGRERLEALEQLYDERCRGRYSSSLPQPYTPPSNSLKPGDPAYDEKHYRGPARPPNRRD
jgi:hypothetical protein